MSLFFSQVEREQLANARWEEPLASIYVALLRRAERRAESPGLTDPKATLEWWHYASSYLTDAAFAWTIKPSPNLTAWLRDVMLSLARRPLPDWMGPGFRNHDHEPPLGHLETGHLSWGLAIALDIAGDVLTDDERAEVAAALREKGMDLCRNWLNHAERLTNWHCILLAGYSVAAAVLNDEAALAFSREEFTRCVNLFQGDGSYGESLQYGDYALSGLVLTREALLRRQPEQADTLPIEPYVFKPRWDAASLLYMKPMSGWSSLPLPRSVNFGDSAAIYGPSADNLMHIAVRAKESHPTMAGLASWLFEKLYGSDCGRLPAERNSFGFANGFGFLALILWPSAASPISPEEAGVQQLESFSCGNVIARNTKEPRTTLAARTASEPLHAVAHLHADANSFMVVHNNERLLADAGHACYRSLVHNYDIAAQQHNVCSLNDRFGTQLALKNISARKIESDGSHGAPSGSGGSLLIAQQLGNVTAISSDIAERYGAPVKTLTRTWLLCGEHALFVIDRLSASEPLSMTWHWLLNNRDGELDLKIVSPDRLVARRGNAGMKLFHVGQGHVGRPTYGYMHDAYHPLPNQLGEGDPGSGMMLHFRDATAREESTVVHAICLDTPDGIYRWHLKAEEGYTAVVESPAKDSWKLTINDDATQFGVWDSTTGTQTTLRLDNQQGTLTNE